LPSPTSIILPNGISIVIITLYKERLRVEIKTNSNKSAKYIKLNRESIFLYTITNPASTIPTLIPFIKVNKMINEKENKFILCIKRKVLRLTSESIL
jgi:hypothetical protein